MKQNIIIKLKKYIGNRDVQKTHFKKLKKELFRELNITILAQELFDILYPEKIIRCDNSRFVGWGAGYSSCKKGCECYVKNLSSKISKIKKNYSKEKRKKVLDTRKSTVREKYKVDNVFQLIEVKEKANNTKIKKYSDKNYNNRDKYKNTCLRKYNTENVMQIDEVKLRNHTNRDYQEASEKGKKTKLRKYGNENYNNIAQIKQTNSERYGVENVSQNLDIRKKI